MPAALTLRLQQKKFDRFRYVFNYERPHEGLNNATPRTGDRKCGAYWES
jgi:hypothetical protein